VKDEMSFNHEGKRITGVVVKVNQKTLSVKTKEGVGWYGDSKAGAMKSQLPLSLF